MFSCVPFDNNPAIFFPPYMSIESNREIPDGNKMSLIMKNLLKNHLKSSHLRDTTYCSLVTQKKGGL